MKIYRDPAAELTWVDRGGGVVVEVPDRGDVEIRWRALDPANLVHDDDAHTGEDAVLARARDRLTEAVAGSDLPASAKARVRAIVAEVLA